jgi:hypothetical protein
MSSTWNLSPAELAAAIAQANAEGPPMELPAVAAENPFLEVVVAEVKATLPPAFAAQVQAAPDLSALMDWVAAAAMYRWIQDDPAQAAAFLNMLSRGPRRACEAFASSVAVHADPPERDAVWRACDRSGILLQLSVAAGLLLLRAWVVLQLARGAGVATASLPLAKWLGAAADAPLMPLGVPSTALIAALAALVFWHAWEIFLFPRLMERARQLPSAFNDEALPLAWRGSTFYAVWGLQSAAFMACAVVAGLHASYLAIPWAQKPHAQVVAWVLLIGWVAFIGAVIAVKGVIGLLDLGSKPAFKRPER